MRKKEIFLDFLKELKGTLEDEFNYYEACADEFKKAMKKVSDGIESIKDDSEERFLAVLSELNKVE